MILIFGSNGYLGSAITRALDDQGMTWQAGTIDAHFPSRFADLVEQITDADPDFVINAAAFIPPNSVYDCEESPLETVRGNYLLPVELAHACQICEVTLVHISTGCLFQGDNGVKGWSEEDAPQLTWDQHPGIYLASKHAAELVVAANPDNYIFRVRLLFDQFDHPRNLLTKMANFHWICSWDNSLTNRTQAAGHMVELLMKNAHPGIYHLTNPGAISSEELSKMVRISRGINGNPEFESPEEFQLRYPKTIKSNCVLSCQKLEKALGHEIMTVHESVEFSLNNWTSSTHVYRTHPLPHLPIQ
jgi:dTDP-4-dehydrorhamnose reductase